jgi:diaminopimelate decarboxylase
MTTAIHLDDCLTRRNGHLFIEACDTIDLIQRFGSPLFVLSEDQIRRNVQQFQSAFQSGWPNGVVKVLPAAKANWISAVQRILADDGCGCDVYSPGELTVALNAGVDPQYISVNGVPKDDAHIARSIQVGARITIDSVEEVDVIERAANELNRTAKVRLRLKPPIAGFIQHSDFVPEGLVPTDIAALAYKGGLPIEQVIALGQRILNMKNVELVGFHQHHGRHHASTRYWEEQMKAYAAALGQVCQALGGYQPHEIDIGGGFAIPRDPFNKVTNYTEPLQYAALHGTSKVLKLFGAAGRYKVMAKLISSLVTHPNKKLAPTIEAYAEACTRTLRRELPKHGINTTDLMLQLEPGRALHGNTGIHLTTVRNIKRMAQPIKWNIVVVDTTEFWFTGGRYEHHLHDYVFANKVDAPLIDKADIIGRSCYGDRLFPIVPIPHVEVGDVLAMLDTGAYQEVSMSNFNAMPRPATVLVTGDQAAIIRRRETEDDVFRRDELPEHLRRKVVEEVEHLLAGTKSHE